MNRLLAGPLVALALGSNLANATSLDEQECAGWASLVGTIARAHQAEVPLAKVLESKTISADEDPALGIAVRKIIVMIYSLPRYRSEKNQQRFINELRDDIHARCLIGKWALPRLPEDPA